MKKYVEFRNLEKFAEFIGYEFPEEIYIVAVHEGFYDTDEQGDKYLSKDGMNDFLNRLGANLKVITATGFIYCEYSE